MRHSILCRLSVGSSRPVKKKVSFSSASAVSFLQYDPSHAAHVHVSVSLSNDEGSGSCSPTAQAAGPQFADVFVLPENLF